MEALEQVALTGQVTVRAVLSLFVRPLAIVVLAGFAVPALVAVAVANFAHPLVSPVMVRVVEAFGGERALHYPGNLVLLPVVLAKLGRISNWLTLTLLLGWAGTVTAYGPRGVGAGAALAGTLQRLPRLLVAGVPLAFAYGVAAGMGTQAVADLPRRFISALGHLVAGFALETFVLAAAMLVLPLVLRTDLPLRAIPGALKRAFHWGGVAAPLFGFATAGLAVVGRVACARAAALMVATRPDGVLAVVLFAALVTSAGCVVFAAVSEVLATALDEGWS
jgi:hypothetical protein